MDVFFVYGLVDAAERDEIRYVGQTSKLLFRFKQHSQGCLWDWSPPSLWKRTLKAFGRSFDIILIEVVYGTREQSLAREKFHIDRLAAETGRILNGVAYRRTQRSRGVPQCVAETYLDAFAMMLRGWEAGLFLSRNSAASIVDRLHRHYHSLAICHRLDNFSWADRVEEKISREPLTA